METIFARNTGAVSPGRSSPSMLSWRAVAAGFVLSLLAYSILMSLGLALGGQSLSKIAVEGGGAQALGIGSGIWAVVSVLISLFVGSLLASRICSPLSRRVGGVQGLVVAGLFFGFMIAQVASGIGLLGRGIGATVGAIGAVGGDLASNPQVQAVIESSTEGLNLKSSPETVLRGVTTRLLSGNDLEAQSYLAAQAGMSTTEAAQRISNVRTRLDQTLQQIGDTAGQTLAIAGWTLFGAMVLGSFFSLLGGSLGASDDERRRPSRSVINEREQHQPARRTDHVA